MNTRQIVFILTAALLSGCSTINQQLKAGPAPTSNFLEHRDGLREWHERVPLQLVWMYDRNDFYRRRDGYTEIYFAPVRTDFVSAPSRTEGIIAGGAGMEDIDRMALFIRESFRKTFRNDPRHRFTVVERPGPNTLVYELALTELLPTRVGVNVAGTALGAFLPGGSLIKVVGKGSIAIEAKVRDGGTGELLVEWQDREQDKVTLVSLAEFAPYSFSRQAVREWADQLLLLYHTPQEFQVQDSSVFTLRLL